MLDRLMVYALGLACALAVLFLVAFESKGADFDKDWLYGHLTCEELVVGYFNSIQMLTDVLKMYNECQAYNDSPADDGHGALQCALIKKDGMFIQGMANDIVAVFEAKHCRDQK